MSGRALTAAVIALLLASCGGTEPVSEASEFIVQHRPWAAGERAAQIALVKQYGSLGFATDLVDSLFPQDWITEVVPNPAFQASLAGSRWLQASLNSPTTPGMIIVGLDYYIVDTTSPPQTATDTTQWLMVFWYDNTDPTYKGFTVVFSRTATLGPTTLNTTSFDAANGTSGGGGGEIRPSTGEYWEATGGKMQINSNSARTAAGSTITSGPFTGGTQRNGLFGGRLMNVTLSQILPTTGPVQTVSLDFRAAANQIPAARLECTFNPAQVPPCT
jgi:hypothetical protein